MLVGFFTFLTQGKHPFLNQHWQESYFGLAVTFTKHFFINKHYKNHILALVLLF